MGKGGESSSSSSTASLRSGAAGGASVKGSSGGVAAVVSSEVLIDGVWYDTSSFKHPGGRVLSYYAGRDATQAYHEFHQRSAKAAKFLKTLPSREAQPSESESSKDGLVRDFDELRMQLEKEGFFKPNYAHTVYRLAELAVMCVAGVALWMQGYKAASVVMIGIMQGRCGWLMHEGGHYSLTGNIKVDRALQIFLYGTGCGMSASWWRNQHNKHHATPQKVGYDVDLNTLPLVAFCKDVLKSSHPTALKAWLKLQPWLFIPVTNQLVGFGWQFYLHPRHIIRTKNVAEMAAFAARFAIIGALTYALGAGNTAALYLATNTVSFNYIFLNFAVSHTHLPTLQKHENTDWVRYAAVHTMNVHSSWWCNWWMAYLNFQIEHHLFPSMPQYRHPIVSPRVRAMFEKHGVKYDSRGYLEAMHDCFSNLKSVGDLAFTG